MFIEQKKFLYFLSALCVPCLTLSDPKWLALDGVGPYWVILWLLPWSIERGSGSAMVAGLLLGMTLDSIHIDQFTQIPALVGLGFWWGSFRRRGLKIDNYLSLGLLACIGTGLCGLSLMAQISFVQFSKGVFSTLLLTWGVHTFFCQLLITGLLAPIICSLLLLFFRNGRGTSV